MRDLYCDPRTEPDVWRTPLGALFLDGPIHVFRHPAVLKAASTRVWTACCVPVNVAAIIHALCDPMVPAKYRASHIRNVSCFVSLAEGHPWEAEHYMIYIHNFYTYIWYKIWLHPNAYTHLSTTLYLDRKVIWSTIRWLMLAYTGTRYQVAALRPVDVPAHRGLVCVCLRGCVLGGSDLSCHI